MRKDLIKPGDRVHFSSITDPSLGVEDGIVKSLPHTGLGVEVVYKCEGRWHEYQNYPSEWTHIEDLKPGWVAENIVDEYPYQEFVNKNVFPSVAPDDPNDYEEPEREWPEADPEHGVQGQYEFDF